MDGRIRPLGLRVRSKRAAPCECLSSRLRGSGLLSTLVRQSFYRLLSKRNTSGWMGPAALLVYWFWDGREARILETLLTRGACRQMPVVRLRPSYLPESPEIGDSGCCLPVGM